MGSKQSARKKETGAEGIGPILAGLVCAALLMGLAISVQLGATRAAAAIFAFGALVVGLMGMGFLLWMQRVQLRIPFSIPDFADLWSRLLGEAEESEPESSQESKAREGVVLYV